MGVGFPDLAPITHLGGTKVEFLALTTVRSDPMRYQIGHKYSRIVKNGSQTPVFSGK